MTENRTDETAPNSEGPKQKKHDSFERATLGAAFAGVIAVTASTGVAAYTAWVIKGQLDEMRSSDPVVLAQSNAAVSISNTAAAQLVAAGKLADAAAVQSQAAKDQVVQMRASVAAAQAQVATAQRAFLEGNRPVISLINTKITTDQDKITISFLLYNTGEQAAFLDVADFEVGPTIELTEHRANLDQVAACPAIFGPLTIPKGQGIPVTCSRIIRGEAAQLAKRNNWMILKAFWNYHSQTGARWSERDTEACSPVSLFCGPPDPNLIALTDPVASQKRKQK